MIPILKSIQLMKKNQLKHYPLQKIRNYPMNQLKQRPFEVSNNVLKVVTSSTLILWPVVT